LDWIALACLGDAPRGFRRQIEDHMGACGVTINVPGTSNDDQYGSRRSDASGRG
jgi:hypothetical protein